jgi:hypothetical protein
VLWTDLPRCVAVGVTDEMGGLVGLYAGGGSVWALLDCKCLLQGGNGRLTIVVSRLGNWSAALVEYRQLPMRRSA